MTIIQQPTLFDIDFLSQLDIQERHAEIFAPIDFTPILMLFQKGRSVGAPITVNYEAAFRAIVTRFIEKIPTTKALVKRLNEDLSFKLSLGFLYSDKIPSEATFSRIFRMLGNHSELLNKLNNTLLKQINQEFAIFSEPVAIDATAIEGRAQSKKTDNPKMTQTIEQRKLETEELLKELPIYPSWGVKANSKGKHNYWFGHKAHFAVSSDKQFLLQSLTTSAFVPDVSVAIPLIRKLHQLGVSDTTVTMDKGYDANAIYEEAHDYSFEPIIDVKAGAKNDGEVDQFFAPTCFREHSYQYDSFDKRYNALKFRRPETHCRDCPLQAEGLCQKIYKVKQVEDYRKYAKPARGTKAWQKIYNTRSAVERVNAYLKEWYQLGKTNFYDPKKVVVEHLFIQLAYNAKKFANERLKKRLKKHHEEKEIAV